MFVLQASSPIVKTESTSPDIESPDFSIALRARLRRLTDIMEDQFKKLFDNKEPPQQLITVCLQHGIRKDPIIQHILSNIDRIRLEHDIDKSPVIYVTSRRQADRFPNTYDLDSLFQLDEFFDCSTAEQLLLTPEQLEHLRAIFQGIRWLIIDVAECEIELEILSQINERLEEVLGRPYTMDDDYDNLCFRDLNVVLIDSFPSLPQVDELQMAKRPLSRNPEVRLGSILFGGFTTIELCDNDVNVTSNVWNLHEESVKHASNKGQASPPERRSPWSKAQSLMQSSPLQESSIN